MNPKTAFTVYNAAAGAGKTYTLVKSYLITLLTGTYRDSYKNILAITFTNKAVAEMKSRVLRTLVGIGSPNGASQYAQLLREISEETQLSVPDIRQKAARMLKSILHNYAGFDIVTIDTFTHRVIRTFAKDLEIPMNFEIEMDAESLIDEAVAALIAKIGVDEEFTKIIIEFALRKLEDDKSWDITAELTKIGRLLFSENDRKHLAAIVEKQPSDFENLKKTLQKNSDEAKQKVVSLSQQVLEVIAEKGIDTKDFTRGSVPAHFQKLASGSTAVDFKASWKQNIRAASFYNKTLESGKKASIDSIRPTIEEVFLVTKEELSKVQLYENCRKNVTPLSVLKAIYAALQEINKERNILLISEFNKIISEAIQDQPAPFIYERLGERYRDYFIDEFQDTSELQWQNMIPLIDNAIATETLTGKRGQVTIVGDAKQAIYRWRGGKAEQFIDLSLNKNPFSVQEKQVLNLPKNYRSYDTVINFNNDLFTFLSNDFVSDVHRKLYLLGNNQACNDKKGGYVNLSFITAKNVAEEHEVYPEKVYEIILELQAKHYPLDAICILTRKQKEGAVIADYLATKGIPIISSETLLLKNDPRVLFIIDVLKSCVFSDDLIAKTQLLYFIATQYGIQSKHAFLKEMLHAEAAVFSAKLQELGIAFYSKKVTVLPLYDAVEYIIRSFDLGATAPAYIQFFLDTVFAYTQQHSDGIIGFLSYWEHKKEKLSIIAPEGEAAVKIMTIHKSKGLEFPCVIYPYANIDIYREIEPKTWLPVDATAFHGFEEVFINYSKDIAEFNEDAAAIVWQRQSQLELDMLNLLYVALTRAEAQLYVISKMEINSKGEINENKFSGKFIKYLKHLGRWDSEQFSYDFGDPNASNQHIEVEKIQHSQAVLHTFENAADMYKVQIVTNAAKLWDSAQQTAIEKGNLIHDIMASIQTVADVEIAVVTAYEQGMIASATTAVLTQELEAIVHHPELSLFFAEDVTVLNERDIISKGALYRPDRVVVDSEGHAVILDYKTGEPKTQHASQLVTYGVLLQELGYTVRQKILVYCNAQLHLHYVN